METGSITIRAFHHPFYRIQTHIPPNIEECARANRIRMDEVTSVPPAHVEIFDNFDPWKEVIDGEKIDRLQQDTTWSTYVKGRNLLKVMESTYSEMLARKLCATLRGSKDGEINDRADLTAIERLFMDQKAELYRLHNVFSCQLARDSNTSKDCIPWDEYGGLPNRVRQLGEDDPEVPQLTEADRQPVKVKRTAKHKSSR